MSAKLKPDLILVATSMKTPLFVFEVVDVNSEFLAGIKHRCFGTPLSGHAGKIVETSNLLEGPRTARDGAEQCGSIPLDPNIGLWIPESDVLDDAATLSVLATVRL